jgi:type IV pilus assembly protein PilX
MATKADSILKNQSGMALVVALIMIIVLTLIALASSYTSIFEIKLSGTKRASTDAFYAADAGISQIITNTANFNLNSYDASTHTYTPFSDSANATPNPTNVVATITYVPTQSGPPRGMGLSAVNLGYAYYQIQSVGKDQQSSLSPASTTTIQEEVARLLPLQ